MASEQTVADDGPAPDPFEAELVAYLDGELDGPEARRVEARLAKDPGARARAAELKKSFDLLDYLPRPEPSPTFTTRTIDKLPAVSAGPVTPAPQSEYETGVSASVAVPIEPAAPAPVPVRRAGALRVAGFSVAVVGCAVLGYFAAGAARTYLGPRAKEPEEAKIELEARVAERLPLYAPVDDLAFVAELAKPELFGGDPAVIDAEPVKPPTADVADRPTGKEFEAMVRAFRALPPARQAEIVKLDQDLHAKEPRERDHLFRVLEAYAVWLERLPDADRRKVLGAPDARARLGAVRALRARQWLDALPPAVRARPDAVQQWRDEEEARREWVALVTTKTPWPFDTDAGRRDVIDYARGVFKTNDTRRCRLAPEELAEFNRAVQAGQRDEGWGALGLVVYELTRLHPYLPEPDGGKLVTDLGDLPEAYTRAFMKKGLTGVRIKPSAYGKWPDFALEIHEQPFAKSMTNPPPLGPARHTDFKKPVQEFATKELFPKLTADERAALDKLAGKWPEYPRQFLELARKYDLSVPGVTPPGSPKRWDATYAVRPPRH